MKALKLHDKVTIIPRFSVPGILWGRTGVIIETESKGPIYKIEIPNLGHYWILRDDLELISRPHEDYPNLF